MQQLTQRKRQAKKRATCSSYIMYIPNISSHLKNMQIQIACSKAEETAFLTRL